MRFVYLLKIYSNRNVKVKSAFLTGRCPYRNSPRRPRSSAAPVAS